eukprot:CAMPEP_0181121312 /NCGR_PEP_ID=MMETSP1071-20121207/24668_1 /TAXON_ID=35127 /ORGANISM="Thalassiosira sp., Strain NH16" /LENGTH=294 /DNA_ID=CAMNT_0023206117 /DNA_START=176 /DNA_END=1057 /DNA_ORIENTATION=+
MAPPSKKKRAALRRERGPKRRMMDQQEGNGFPIMELPGGVLGHVVTILHEPSDILNLALTCHGLRVICEGVARTFIDGATDEKRNNLPQVNLPTTCDLNSPGRSSSFASWGFFSKYQQILKHQEGLTFDQLVGDVEYSDPNDKSKITSSGERGFGVSNRIMRSGVHRATFEFSGEGMSGRGAIFIGIARPMDYQRIALHGYQYTYPSSEPVRKKYPSAWRDEVIINIVQHSSSGNTWLYKGLEAITINENVDFPFSNGDRIGLVLNLDAGTLSMHKNGIYVGELCSGLEGEYLW